MAMTDDAPVTTTAALAEIRLLTEDGKAYADPLPWCPILGGLGISEESYQPGDKFIRITSLLQFLPAPALIYWAAKMAAIRAWDVGHLYRAWDMQGAMIADCQQAGDRYRDNAAVRGTAVHDLAEEGVSAVKSALFALMNGESHGDLAPEAIPYVEALRKFQVDYAAIDARIIWSEIAVFSRRLRVAGRGDLVMWIPGRGLWLVDIKTSNHILDKYDLQTAFYQHADYGIVDNRRVLLPPIQGRVILWIKADGNYEMVEQEPNQVDPFKVLEALQVVREWDTGSHRSKVWPSPTTWGIEHVAREGNELEFLTVADLYAAERQAREAESAHDKLVRQRVAFEHAELDWIISTGKWLDERCVMLRQYAGDMGNWIVEQYQTWTVGTQVDMSNMSTRELVARMSQQYQCLKFYELQAESFDTRQIHAEVPFLNEMDWVAHPGEQLLNDELRAQITPFLPGGRMVSFEQLPAEVASWLIDTQVANIEIDPPLPDGSLGQLVLDSPGGVHAIVPARRGMSIDVRSFTRPDPQIVERCQRIINRLAALPADMSATIGALGREAGIPLLLSWQATSAQLDLIETWIGELESETDERIAQVDQMVIELLPDDVDGEIRSALLTALIRWSAVGSANSFELSGPHQVEICQGICIGLRTQCLGTTLDDDQVMQLVSLTSAAQLTTWFDNASGARTAAKAACDRLGLPWAGRGVKEYAAQPLTIAAVMLSLEPKIIEAKAAVADKIRNPPAPVEPEPEPVPPRAEATATPVLALVAEIVADDNEPDEEDIDGADEHVDYNHVDVVGSLLGIERHLVTVPPLAVDSPEEEADEAVTTADAEPEPEQTLLAIYQEEVGEVDAEEPQTVTPEGDDSPDDAENRTIVPGASSDHPTMLVAAARQGNLPTLEAILAARGRLDSTSL